MGPRQPALPAAARYGSCSPMPDLSVAGPAGDRSAPAADPAPALLHDFFTRAARRWGGRVAVETPPGPGRPAGPVRDPR